MLPSLSNLPFKHSTESFVSPSAQIIESESASGPRGTLRRLRSISQFQNRAPLPKISSLLVIRLATVSVRQKTWAWWRWTRQTLVLTKRTISLHRSPRDPNTLDIIVLLKVRHVGRDDKQPRCLRVETTDGTNGDKTYYFAFDQEEELYNWLTDLHLLVGDVSKPTNVKHVLHIGADQLDKYDMTGLPEQWQLADSSSTRESITREMVKAALPEISLSGREPIIDLGDVFMRSRPASPDSYFGTEGEMVIPKADLSVRPVTQGLFDNQSSGQPLRIITEDFSSRPFTSNSSITPAEDSHPPLTPDRSPSTPDKSPWTPDRNFLIPDKFTLSPFRESPYSYRDSEAQNLSGQIHRQSAWPDAHGGYADIWRAQWLSDIGVCLPVAVKVLRVLSQDENVKAKIQRRLRKEVSVWHQLRHKNIVQMYGTCEGFGPFPSMVSAWYENGNVNTYLRKLGGAATVERRLKLLTEVACGLNYLHTFAFPVSFDSKKEANIVHGDLKGANILVNDDGEAALADFGLSSVIIVAGESSASNFGGGSVRWMAPELLHLRDVVHKTCASDTYSYGSVMLEIITGERPYNDIANDMQVINQLMQGCKPTRPQRSTVNPGIWDLMERCWNSQASERPKMAFVLSRMEKFYHERVKSAMLLEDKFAYAM